MLALSACHFDRGRPTVPSIRRTGQDHVRLWTIDAHSFEKANERHLAAVINQERSYSFAVAFQAIRVSRIRHVLGRYIA